MKKIILLLILLIPLNVFSLNVEIVSKSAIIVNRENDEILYEKNIDEKLPIASLTKIMATLVALENINDFDSKITITKDDIDVTNDYVTVGLKENLEVTYKDLLYSTMLQSAADSAIALSNHTFDNYDKFINKMNELAKKLNMNNTNFSNPVGFDDNNYSTVNDLYKLLDYALNNQNFYEIYTTQKYDMRSLDKSINNYVNNAIEKSEIKNDGILFRGTKTGFTSLSGASLSGITTIDNNEILIITVGAIGLQDERLHLIDSMKLLTNLKETYSNRILIKKDTLVDNIIYKKGKKRINYEIKVNETITHYMDNTLDLNYLKIYYDGIKELSDSNKDNEIIGNINVFYNDKLLEEQIVRFNKSNLIKENINYKNVIIILGVCILGLFIFKKKKRN